MERKDLPEKEKYDLIIVGGGASASLLALQIFRVNSAFRVLILEKKSSFTLKLGESVVDQTALLFRDLGLDHLLEKHALKTGVRFLFNEKNSSDLSDIAEFASPTLPGHIKGYHLNRAIFDQDLLDEAERKGARVYRPVTLLSARHDPFDNELELEIAGEIKTVISKWVVDASGRARYFHQSLNWIDKPIDLNTAAISAHFQSVAAPENWDTPQNAFWDEKSIGSRQFSTTHLMRKNAWWWIIKLDETTTSIGTVIDRNKIKFEDPIAYFKNQLETDSQLKQLTSVAQMGTVNYLEKLPYVSEQLVTEGQAVIGDSGAFIDPLISPGLELIGQQAIWLAALFTADFKEDHYNEKAWKKYEQTFHEAYAARLAIYKNAYGLMDSFELFSAWLKQGNYVYFSWLVYPSIISKKRLKKPLRFNALERVALRYFIRRFNKIHAKREREGRFSGQKPNAIAYSGVRVPKNALLFLMPFYLFLKAISAYCNVEWIELKSRLTKK